MFKSDKPRQRTDPDGGMMCPSCCSAGAHGRGDAGTEPPLLRAKLAAVSFTEERETLGGQHVAHRREAITVGIGASKKSCLLMMSYLSLLV